ncbi:MAG: molecular chaperone DnaJ [Actinomycetota bacterium]|nr:molecular chaperone DnaJ [Actinomycetota bacterium]
MPGMPGMPEVAGMPADYYELLGVDRGTSEDEIKRAYRRKARELHPDRTGGDAASEALFKEVTRAYEVLRDPERRARYDRFGPEGVDGPGVGQMGDAFFGGGIGDIFDAFFGGSMAGGRRRRAGPSRGGDAEVALELDLRDAIFGARREVRIELPVTCGSCGGSGAREGTSAIRCPDCAGSGEVRRVRQSILGQVMTAAPCSRCGGTGEAVSSPCPECRGSGRVTKERSLTVDVPAGVDHGSTLRLSGHGPAGPRGGPPGDLYVHLALRPDGRFERRGDDLHAQVHVAMTQAALGTTVSFETFDGTEEIAVAAGTQSGTEVRMRGRGVPHVRSRGRGDLVVTIIVDTPTDLTKSQQELLRQLAAERSEDVGAPSESILSRLRSALG